jgi:argininosuccinate lyase
MMIEVNPRLAGGFIPELARLSTGVDLIDAVIRKAAGLPLDLAPRRHAHASIRFLIPPGPGVLTSVAGLEEARNMRGVEEIALYRPIGERLALQGDFRDRIGHVIASSDDAGALADAAFARIRITVEAS